MFSKILNDLDSNDVLKPRKAPLAGLNNPLKRPISSKQLDSNILKENNEDSLLIPLTKRVGELEKLLNSQRMELREKNSKICILNEELDKIKLTVDKGALKKIEELEKNVQNKDKKIKDLEDFLKQYGLISKISENGYEFNPSNINQLSED